MSTSTTLAVDPGNVRQRRDWDGEHGRYWADYADFYNRSVAGYHPHLLTAADPRATDRILDVGCGSGQVAIDLVKAVPGALALGVDLSAAQLEIARRRAASLAVEFTHADAQVHHFGPAAYDLIVSRTGTMFFADQTAAFANLAAATKPGGRLAILVWRGLHHNQWLREILEALRVGRDLPMPPAGAPGPFAQSNPALVEPILEAAGWCDTTFEALDHPIWLGPNAEQGTRWQLGQAAWLLRGLDQAQRAIATANLKSLFAAHQTRDGVELGSAAWLITARRLS